jgi:hypothetical protein
MGRSGTHAWRRHPRGWVRARAAEAEHAGAKRRADAVDVIARRCAAQTAWMALTMQLTLLLLAGLHTAQACVSPQPLTPATPLRLLTHCRGTQAAPHVHRGAGLVAGPVPRPPTATPAAARRARHVGVRTLPHGRAAARHLVRSACVVRRHGNVLTLPPPSLKGPRGPKRASIRPYPNPQALRAVP